MSVHTKGPWKFDVGNWQIEVEGSRTAIADLCTRQDEDTGELPDAFANGHRIVECVNACDGIENPDKALRAAKAALKRAHARLLKSDDCEFTRADIHKIETALAALNIK